MKPRFPVAAFDVGGANIKLASNNGLARSSSFAMWKYPDRLADKLSEMLRDVPGETVVAATMTGELADCFANKKQGVHHIIAALESVAANRPLHIYLTDGRLVSPAEAREQYRLAAASNWHALAAFIAGRETWQNSLLIDIGSTTCDVIPITDGKVAALGRTDLERLLARELVYVGAERTSLVSLSGELPFRDQMCPVARERFATSLDVQLILNNIADRPDDCETADGRPATKAFAISRLARCICADDDDWTQHDAEIAARFLSQRIADLLAESISHVYESHPSLRVAPIVVSGHGEYLLEPLLSKSVPREQITSLRDDIGSEAARSAPAYALARLAERML